jgi:lipopolysaccharide transport system ATP-binding protein
MSRPISNSEEVLIRVDNVSKKFCRDLKKSLWYGLQDTAAEIFKPSRPGPPCLSLDESGEQLPLLPPLRPGEFWANSNISFEVKRGECLGLIGSNGAGKTTLLKMLNGLIKPDTGRIVMRGRIGALIALGAGFNPVLTGRENIYVNGSILGLPKNEIKTRLDEIVDFADIADAIDAPVRTYSSGMHVRLGFAVAAVLVRPDILIVDEVLAVGDLEFKVKCLNAIGEMLSRTAVILVSHSMPQIASAATMGLVLKNGTMVQPPIEVGRAIACYYKESSKETKSTSITGHSEFAVTSFKINDNEEEIPSIRQGDRWVANLHVTFTKQPTDVRVLLIIRNLEETAIISTRSPVFYDPGHLLEVTIDLGPMNLAPGTYTVSLWFNECDGRPESKILGSWQAGARFELLATSPEAHQSGALLEIPGNWDANDRLVINQL